MHMNLKASVLSIGFCLLGSMLFSQDLSVRFKAGLGFSQILGDAETVNDEEVEEVRFTNGFHLGIGLGVPFTDHFGARAMVLYMQRGMEYSYEGPSYFVFDGANGNLLPSIGGNRKTTLEVTNSYISIPLTAYARFNRIEFEAGVYAGLLVTSRADGELTFSNPSANLEPVTLTLDYDYNADGFERPTDVEVFNRFVNGVQGSVPQTINAYYESVNNEEKRYNLFDFGLTADVAFYLNQGLYIGVGIDYGLLDVTNDEQDLNVSSLDPDRNFVSREDVDQNLTLKASIGFNF